MSAPHKRSRDRAGQYLRVSVDKSGRARSNDEQQSDNEQDAVAEGLQMVRTYRDPDRSASRYATKMREEYELLLRDIATGALDVLYLWEPSRGSRRVSEWVTLIELCEDKHVQIRVTSHHRTYDPAHPRDRRSLLEDAVDSEYESGKVSMRVKRSLAASAAEGKPHGKVPFGFLRYYHPQSGQLLEQVPDPDTAPIVREIVRRVLAGETVRAIADNLTERAVPTPADARARRLGQPMAGQPWAFSTIRSLLATPTSIGLRVHRGEIVGDARWDPLVPAVDYERARAILRSRAMQTNPGSKPKWLLSGIATCAVCDATCVRQINNGVPSYVCGGNRPAPGEARPSRKHVTRAQEPVDQMVIYALLRRAEKPDFLEAVYAGLGDDGTARREVENLRATMRVLEDSLGTASTPEAAGVFQRQVNALAARLADAERAVTPVTVHPVIRDLAGPDASSRWSGMPLMHHRLLVRSLIAVKIHRAVRRGSRMFDDSTVELSWRYPGLSSGSGAT